MRLGCGLVGSPGEDRGGLAAFGRAGYNMRLPGKFFPGVVGLLDESGTWQEMGSITGAGREWGALEKTLTGLDPVG